MKPRVYIWNFLELILISSMLLNLLIPTMSTDLDHQRIRRGHPGQWATSQQNQIGISGFRRSPVLNYQENALIPNRRREWKISQQYSTKKGRPSPIRREPESEEKEVEVDDTLNKFIGLLGPLGLPVPFLLALAPLTVPAIPIALYLAYSNRTITEDARTSITLQ